MNKQKLERLMWLWENVDVCEMSRTAAEGFGWEAYEPGLLANIDELGLLLDELLLNELSKDLT